ncbi:hypothetical protein SKAU_G00325630 [Synaphobranchus kaupii]|uniref:Uncharacterized protein n=1 Tax=Synaphobranchus kaupii TaxID=118154 RepID=A0A9Q1EPI6_SYNKA|nr:hypothetical protein SKAU_G00325630 [Synaphobranchus kaupii]
MSSDELRGTGGGVAAGIIAECGEGQDDVILVRIGSLPVDLFSASDFRGKFKKIHSKRRPSILDELENAANKRLTHLLTLPPPAFKTQFHTGTDTERAQLLT